MNCIQCSIVPVTEEYTRCGDCGKAHSELAKKLDSRPIVKEKRVKEVLIPIVTKKKVQYPDGVREIDYTTYYTRQEAEFWGLKIPEGY